MNLLLWTAAATEQHVPLFKNIKQWGFDGVELPMFSTEGSPWRALGTALDKLGMHRTAAVVLPPGADFISENEEERNYALRFITECVDRCIELGAEVLGGPMFSPVGRLVGRGPTDREKDWCVEGLREAGKYAEEKGVFLSVEPLNRFETYFLNTQADALALVERVGVGSVGILYDTFHANIEEKDLAEAIRTGGRHINHVHISANDRATPGEDHIPWETTFAALKAIGYDGWLTLEAFGTWFPELTAAACIWRKMAPSEEHIAKKGQQFIRESW